MATPTPVRPEALASALKVDGKRVRAFLRKTYPRDAEARNTAWNLTPDQVKAVREHFTPKA